ncbi:MAG: hypothetical protein HQL37_01050 [Alphaproteobacteria bacterium]|nr:hypothetical protein [Alphaproteobacteria bacterium]
MEQPYCVSVERLDNQDRRMMGERRSPRERRKRFGQSWLIEITLENGREIVQSRSLLDRRGRFGGMDRRSEYSLQSADSRGAPRPNDPDRGWQVNLEA